MIRFSLTEAIADGLFQKGIADDSHIQKLIDFLVDSSEVVKNLESEQEFVYDTEIVNNSNLDKSLKEVLTEDRYSYDFAKFIRDIQIAGTTYTIENGIYSHFLVEGHTVADMLINASEYTEYDRIILESDDPSECMKTLINETVGHCASLQIARIIESMDKQGYTFDKSVLPR